MTTKPGDWIKVPLDELTTPKGGLCQVYKDRWWSLEKAGNAVFYKSMHSPQCNQNKALVDRLMTVERGYEVGEVVFIPWAFVRVNASDYA